MTARADILAWVAGRIDKRGSFEDYLLRLAMAVRRERLALHIVAGPVCDAGLRMALEAEGATLTLLDDAALRSPRAAAAVLWRTRPRLLHYHFGSPCSLLASLARLMGVERFVFTDHGSRSAAQLADEGGWRRGLRRLRSLAVDRYLPVSAEVGRHLQREIGLPGHKVRPLMNGIDLRRYAPLPEARRHALRRSLFCVAPGEPLLLYAGQLTREKGVEDLLAVQPALLAACPQLTIAWAGDGPLREAVRATAGPRVQVLGRRPDVPDLLRAADLAVAPSRWSEAFSLILAEAAATGVPAVAARIGGIPEVVADGETGLLVPPGAPAALRRAVISLLHNAPRRAAMGAAARRRAERLFDLDAMVRTTIGHYAALLDEPANDLLFARTMP